MTTASLNSTEHTITQNNATQSHTDTHMSVPQLMLRMARLMWHLRAIEIKAIVTGSIGYLEVPALVIAASLSAYYALQESYTWIAWAIVAVLCAASRGWFAYLEQYYNHLMAFTILRDIRNRLFAHLRTLAPARLQEQGRGNLVAVLTDDIELLEIFYAHTMSPLCIAAVTSIISSIAAACVHPLLGVCVLLTYGILGAVIPIALARRTHDIALHERVLQGTLYSQMLESLDAHTQLTFTSALTHARNRTEHTSHLLLNTRQSRFSLSGITTIVLDIASLICILVVAACAGALMNAGAISGLTTLLVVAAYSANLTAIAAVTRLGTGLQPTLAAARRVFALFDCQPYVHDIADISADTTEHCSNTASLKRAQLDVNHINTGYDTNPDILHNLSLHVQPGTITAVSGPNGSGKSTLLNAIMRFIPLSAGDITINSHSLEHTPTHMLRTLETLATQNSIIFSDTFEANLKVAHPQASDADIEQAIDAACLRELVESWPEGIHHVLVRGGIELSDGQRQRLSLARAYVRHAPLMLLDEPTANMDTLLEAQILHNLKQYLHTHAKYSCIIITHRSAVIQIADQHYQLYDGTLLPSADSHAI